MRSARGASVEGGSVVSFSQHSAAPGTPTPRQQSKGHHAKSPPPNALPNVSSDYHDSVPVHQFQGRLQDTLFADGCVWTAELDAVNVRNPVNGELFAPSPVFRKRNVKVHVLLHVQPPALLAQHQMNADAIAGRDATPGYPYAPLNADQLSPHPQTPGTASAADATPASTAKSKRGAGGKSGGKGGGGSGIGAEGTPPYFIWAGLDDGYIAVIEVDPSKGDEGHRVVSQFRQHNGAVTAMAQTVLAAAITSAGSSESHATPVRAAPRAAHAPHCVYSGGYDWKIYEWDWRPDTTSGQITLRRLLHSHSNAVRSLAYTPKGFLVSGSSDTSVRLWDVGTRPDEHHDQSSAYCKIDAHSGAVRCVAVQELPAGSLIWSGDEYGNVHLTGVENCVRVHNLVAAKRGKEDLLSAPPPPVAVRPLYSLHPHRGAVPTITVIGDEVWSCGQDGLILAWFVKWSGGAAPPELTLRRKLAAHKGHLLNLQTCGLFTVRRLWSMSFDFQPNAKKDGGRVVVWNYEYPTPPEKPAAVDAPLAITSPAGLSDSAQAAAELEVVRDTQVETANENVALKAEIAQLTQDLKTERQRVAKLEQSVTYWKDGHADLQREIKRQSQNIDELAAGLDGRRGPQGHIVRDLEEKIEAMEREQVEIEEGARQLLMKKDETCELLRRDMARLNEELTAVTASSGNAERSREEVHKLTTQLADAAREKDRLENLLSDVEEEAAQLRRENLALQAHVSPSPSRGGFGRDRDRDRDREDTARLQSRLHAQEVEFGRLERRLLDAERENDDLSHALADARRLRQEDAAAAVGGSGGKGPAGDTATARRLQSQEEQLNRFERLLAQAEEENAALHLKVDALQRKCNAAKQQQQQQQQQHTPSVAFGGAPSPNSLLADTDGDATPLPNARTPPAAPYPGAGAGGFFLASRPPVPVLPAPSGAHTPTPGGDDGPAAAGPNGAVTSPQRLQTKIEQLEAAVKRRDDACDVLQRQVERLKEGLATHARQQKQQQQQQRTPPPFPAPSPSAAGTTDGGDAGSVRDGGDGSMVPEGLLRELEVDVRRLEGLYVAAEAEITQLAGELRARDAREEEHAEVVARLEDARGEGDDDAKRLRMEISTLRTELDEAARTLRDRDRELRHWEQLHAAAEDEVRTLAGLASTAPALRDDDTTAPGSPSRASSTHGGAGGSTQQQQDAVVRASQLSTVVREKEAENLKLERLYLSATAEVEKLAAQLHDVQEDAGVAKVMADLRETVAEYTTTIESLRKDNTTLQTAIDAAQVDAAEQQKVVASLKELLNERNKSIDMLRDVVQERGQQIETLEDDLRALQSRARDTPPPSAADHQGGANADVERAANLSGVAEASFAPPQPYASATAPVDADRIERLREELDDKRRQVDRLQSQLNETYSNRDELDRLRQQNQGLEDEVEDLNVTIQNLTLKVDAGNHALDECARLRDQLQAADDERARLELALENNPLVLEAQSAAVAFEQDNATLLADNRILAEQQELLQAHIEDLEKGVATTGELAERHARHMALVAQHRDTQEALAAEEALLRAATASQRQLHDVIREMGTLLRMKDAMIVQARAAEAAAVQAATGIAAYPSAHTNDALHAKAAHLRSVNEELVARLAAMEDELNSRYQEDRRAAHEGDHDQTTSSRYTTLLSTLLREKNSLVEGLLEENGARLRQLAMVLAEVDAPVVTHSALAVVQPGQDGITTTTNTAVPPDTLRMLLDHNVALAASLREDKVRLQGWLARVDTEARSAAGSPAARAADAPASPGRAAAGGDAGGGVMEVCVDLSDASVVQPAVRPPAPAHAHLPSTRGATTELARYSALAGSGGAAEDYVYLELVAARRELDAARTLLRKVLPPQHPACSAAHKYLARHGVDAAAAADGAPLSDVPLLWHPVADLEAELAEKRSLVDRLQLKLASVYPTSSGGGVDAMGMPPDVTDLANHYEAVIEDLQVARQHAQGQVLLKDRHVLGLTRRVEELERALAAVAAEGPPTAQQEEAPEPLAQAGMMGVPPPPSLDEIGRRVTPAKRVGGAGGASARGGKVAGADALVVDFAEKLVAVDALLRERDAVVLDLQRRNDAAEMQQVRLRADLARATTRWADERRRREELEMDTGRLAKTLDEAHQKVNKLTHRMDTTPTRAADPTPDGDAARVLRGMSAALRSEEAHVEELLRDKETLAQGLLDAEEQIMRLQDEQGWTAVVASVRALAHALGVDVAASAVAAAAADATTPASEVMSLLEKCRRTAPAAPTPTTATPAAAERMEQEVATAATDIAVRLHLDTSTDTLGPDGLGGAVRLLHRVNDVLAGGSDASRRAPVRASGDVPVTGTFRERVQEVCDSVRILAHVVGVRVDASRGWGCDPGAGAEGRGKDEGVLLLPVIAALQQMRRAAAGGGGAGGGDSPRGGSAPLEIWRTLAAAGYHSGRSGVEAESPKLPVTRPFMELVNAVSLLAGSVGVACGVGIPDEEGKEVASVRQLTEVVDNCARRVAQQGGDRGQMARLEAAYLAEKERRREMMDQVEELRIAGDDLRTLLIHINQSASGSLLRSISLVDAVLPLHPSTTPAADDLTEAIDTLSDLQQYILSETEAFFGLGSPTALNAHMSHGRTHRVPSGSGTAGSQDRQPSLADHPRPAAPKVRTKKKVAKKASVKKKKVPRRGAD